METVIVKVYCGFNKKFNGLFEEPVECCWEDVVEVDAVDWDDGCVSMKCPNCDAELFQDMDHFELIK